MYGRFHTLWIDYESNKDVGCFGVNFFLKIPVAEYTVRQHN